MAEERGEIICDSCGEVAALKQIKNSSNLYLHCKKCGCDRRTGAGIQKKWQAAISGINAEDAETKTEQEITPAAVLTQAAQEWQPTPQIHGRELTAENPENPERITGHKVAVGVVFSLASLGFIYNIIKTMRV